MTVPNGFKGILTYEGYNIAEIDHIVFNQRDKGSLIRPFMKDTGYFKVVHLHDLSKTYLGEKIFKQYYRFPLTMQLNHFDKDYFYDIVLLPSDLPTYYILKNIEYIKFCLYMKSSFMGL